MSLHAQVPTPPTPTVSVEPTDPAGIGVWFLDNLTQPAATVLASLGIIVAALITFAIGLLSRRQLERHHTATHTLADTQALRDRFTTITAQLADPTPSIRTAAVSHGSPRRRLARTQQATRNPSLHQRPLRLPPHAL